MTTASVRRACLLRGAYGAVLLYAPGTVVRAATGGPCDSRVRGVVRLLGARHLLQAGLVAAAPRPAVLRLGRVADLSHAASMLALGVMRPQRRRLAFTAALTAGLLAATGRADTGEHDG